MARGQHSPCCIAPTSLPCGHLLRLKLHAGTLHSTMCLRCTALPAQGPPTTPGAGQQIPKGPGGAEARDPLYRRLDPPSAVRAGTTIMRGQQALGWGDPLRPLPSRLR